VPSAPARLRVGAIGLVVLILCQIYLGALVAGLRAGLLYTTWPLIDGSFLPAASALFFNEPWWRNFFENPLTVQFVHRFAAYVLWIAAVLHAIYVIRTQRGGATLPLVLASAVTIQAALGVATLLYQVPISLALMHQGMAVVVLAIAVVHAERLVPRRSVEAVGQPVAA
jgi:cytochrome c oxidase assembly protein subunit 15